MRNTFRRVLATLLFACILAGSIASISATEAEAGEKLITRMSFIKQVVKTVGLNYKKADSKAVSKYKKQFKTTKTNAKYIAVAVKAGLLGEKQWSTIKTKLSVKDMCIVLAKADEYLYGETIKITRDGNWLFCNGIAMNRLIPKGMQEIRESSTVLEDVQFAECDTSDPDVISVLKAVMLGYHDDLTFNTKNPETWILYKDIKVTAATAKEAVARLKTARENWYNVFIPSCVDIGGQTPTRACARKVLWKGYGYEMMNFIDVQPEWSSSDESVLTIDENGVMTGVKAGKVTVTAAYRGRTYTGEVTVKTPETFDEYMASVGAKKAKDKYHGQGSDPYEYDLEDAYYHPRAGVVACVNGTGELTYAATAAEINEKYKLGVKDADGYIWIINDFSAFSRETDYIRQDGVQGFKFNCQIFDSYSRDYIRLDNLHETFSLNWNGKKWDKCEFFMVEDHVRIGEYNYDFLFRIPKDYDGLVMVLGDEETYSNVKDPADYLKNCELYLKLKAFNGTYDDKKYSSK